MLRSGLRRRVVRSTRRLLGTTGPVRLYFGHHKAATVTINRVLGSVAGRLHLEYRAVHLPSTFGWDLGAYVARGTDVLSYTNAEHHHLSSLDVNGVEFRAIHVIRDPRDLLVSAYYSHLRSHPFRGWPELVEHRRLLEALSLEDGLLAEIEFLRDLPTDGHPCRPIASMVEWEAGDPRILEMRYEDLAADETDFHLRACTHLGLVSEHGERDALSPEELRSLVEPFAFTAMTARQKGTPDPGSHNRRGKPGEWEISFTDAVTARFKEVFPGAVPALGYAPDDTWGPPGGA